MVQRAATGGARTSARDPAGTTSRSARPSRTTGSGRATGSARAHGKRRAAVRTGAPADAAVAGGAPEEHERSTRERILDIALDLFIEKGFDKTSLREIAERLGFSKAALYYHFASKDDIFLALHLRLHEFGHRAIQQLGQAPAGTESWGGLLERLVDEMLANRRIFVLHERNRAALEHLHREEHDESHDDLQEQIRRVLTDGAVPVRSRVRLACAIGALMTGLVASGEVFDDVPSETLGGLLREVVRDLLGHDAEGSGRRGRGGGARAAVPAGRRTGRPRSGRVRADAGSS